MVKKSDLKLTDTWVRWHVPTWLNPQANCDLEQDRSLPWISVFSSVIWECQPPSSSQQLKSEAVGEGMLFKPIWLLTWCATIFRREVKNLILITNELYQY